MERRAEKIFAPMNNKIALKVIPGHFATSHSHVNYYLDMTSMKTRQSEAAEVAEILAGQYVHTTVVDTIVCLDGCEVIGAFLAQELSNSGIISMNQHKTIYVITPEFNTNGQVIIRDNNQSAVYGKNVVLLVASATTGITVRKSIECIQYYGGKLQGISAIFSAVDSIENTSVNAIFHSKDIPDYNNYKV
jgi:orotate phosphoribosyltransferase